MVVDWGRTTNLTGHRNLGEVVEHLVVDAIALQKALEDEIDAPGSGEAVDLGSGAGFPGIPIAMIRPGLRVSLVESRERRHHLQRAVRRHLAVANIEPRWGRIEALSPAPADLVFAQAVAPPSQVLAWAMDWVRPGGILVIPGGADPPEPGSHGDLARQGTGAYGVPGASRVRSFWWCERQGPEAPPA